MMKVFDSLNEENFTLYASNNYSNPQCLSVHEFYDDLSRFKYIKKLLRKYLLTGEIQERLVLNHLIVIYNVFGIEAANRMCFYKLEPELWPSLKTFLIYLSYLPENEQIEVAVDMKIADVLRKI